MCRIKTSISSSTRYLVHQQQEQLLEGAVKQSQGQLPAHRKPAQHELIRNERAEEKGSNTVVHHTPHRPEGNPPVTTSKRSLLAKRALSLPSQPPLTATDARLPSSAITKLPLTRNQSSTSKASSRFPATDKLSLTGKPPLMVDVDTSRYSSQRNVRRLTLPLITSQGAISSNRQPASNSDGESYDSSSYDSYGYSSDALETGSVDSLPLGLSTSVTYEGDLQADTSTFINDSILVYQMQELNIYDDSDDDFGFDDHEELKVKPPRLSEQAINEQQALSSTQGNELDDKINRFLDSLAVNPVFT